MRVPRFQIGLRLSLLLMVLFAVTFAWIGTLKQIERLAREEHVWHLETKIANIQKSHQAYLERRVAEGRPVIPSNEAKVAAQIAELRKQIAEQ